MAKAAVRRKGAPASKPPPVARQEQSAGAVEPTGLLAHNYVAGVFASCSVLSVSLESTQKTLYSDIFGALITLIIALIVGFSPVMVSLKSFIAGETKDIKNRQALAGCVLILAPVYFVFGLYGPCGLATLITMIAAIHFARLAHQKA